jgi:hypothetical protein
MAVYQFNPLLDKRWPEFLAGHPYASAFHTRGWLEALQRTYGFQPVAFTTSSPKSDLANAIVFCRIDSWLTGSRLVSLPFADHCDPLVNGSSDFQAILESLSRKMEDSALRYIELRPLHANRGTLKHQPAFGLGDRYLFHSLDLSGSPAALFSGFDKDCVQRRVRHSERMGLTYEKGRSPELLRKFYHLLILTRRRQRVPPQPLRWFQNLVGSVGENLTIRVISQGPIPVAGNLTLQHKGRLIYKYGCSDRRLNRLAATPSLFWHTIQEAQTDGAHTFDMGRTDLDNLGLIAFKSRWGTDSQLLCYWRSPQPGEERSYFRSQGCKLGQHLLSSLPTIVLLPASGFVYKHAA